MAMRLQTPVCKSSARTHATLPSSLRRFRDGSDSGAAGGLTAAYGRLWGVARLPAVLRLSAVLVTYRLAFLPAEAAAPLKLLEKGVSKVRG